MLTKPKPKIQKPLNLPSGKAEGRRQKAGGAKDIRVLKDIAPHMSLCRQKVKLSVRHITALKDAIEASENWICCHEILETAQTAQTISEGRSRDSP